MYYMGLDLSLNASGLSIIDKDCNIVFQSILHNDFKDMERLYFLRDKFLKILNTYRDSIVLTCIEGYAYNDSGRTFQIGELTGTFKLILFEQGLNYLLVAPLQLKKFITGSGKAKKDLIMLDIYKHWGIEIRDDNMADAYVLAKIAFCYHYKYVINKKVELKKYQEEVLKVMFKNHGVLDNNRLL